MLATLKSGWALLAPGQRHGAMLLVCLLVVGAGFELAAVSVLVPAIKAVQAPATVATNPLFSLFFADPGTSPAAGFFVGIFLLVWLTYLVKNIAILLINRYQFRWIGSVQSELASRLFARYLASDYGFFIDSNSAVLVRSVTEDVKNVVVLIFFAAATLVTEALVAIPLVVFIIWLNPGMALATVIVGALCFLFLSQVISRKLKRVGQDIQTDLSRLIQNVQEGVGGIKELKVLAREPFYQSAFEELAGTYARGLNQHLFFNSVPRLVLEVAFVLVFVCLLLLPSISGDLMASLPVFAVYAAVAFRLIPGLNRAAGAINSLNMGQASLKVVAAGLKPGPAAKIEEPAQPSGRDFDALTLTNVGFHFADGTRAIDDISLTIRAGEKIGIVGESGAGKSTLVDLILGLLPPGEGTIEVNGENIHDNVRAWQARLGYVPQNIFLVDRSLRSNIALGRSDAEIDDARVWAALRKANLVTFVRSLPDGLDTMVGERGVKFSGGQRQRVGIARALYRGPRVLLLDEATSALDAESESQVMAEVAGLTDETVIIIAHRLSTLSCCDRVIEVEAGRIKRETTWQALAK